MKALLNYADRKHEWPNQITIPAATTEILRGMRTRTPGVVVVSEDLASAMQAHDIMRAWFGPAGVVAVPVTEMG